MVRNGKEVRTVSEPGLTPLPTIPFLIDYVHILVIMRRNDANKNMNKYQVYKKKKKDQILFMKYSIGWVL